MSPSEPGPVLLIGIDAAEPALVRRLMERGDLPVLRGLASEGVWGPVAAAPPTCSSALWPSFLSGATLAEHGIYGEWAWRPETLDLGRPSWDHLDPFWRRDARAGRSVTVLDVPFAPLLGLPGCHEVLDWGAHDYLKGRLEVSPPDLEALVRSAGGTHPFAAGGVDAAGPQDLDGLAGALAACIRGAEQRGRLAQRLLAETRPDLFVLVFPEVHHMAHLLWHTVDPTHPDHGLPAPAGPDLPALLRTVDREIGRLRDLAGPGATVLVFSLHGMRAGRGIPTILETLLRAHGFAVPRPWREDTWRDAATRAARALKRGLPDGVKRLYYRHVPRTITGALSQPATAPPAYDWARTMAFALPTDQHGWIRFNLRGREARGIVAPEEYEHLAARLEAVLRAARRADGRAIVWRVFRTAPDARTALTSRLPDLVVYWDDSTFDSPLRLAEPRVAAPAIGRKFTGQHVFTGFYLLRAPGGRPGPDGGPVTPEELHRLAREPLRAGQA
jgi:predicted AlkP superfamily phosphohydrolase/phosphomutase